jgi:hypothetical protein
LVEFGEEQTEQQTGTGEEKQSDDQPLQISKHMIQVPPTRVIHTISLSGFVHHHSFIT